MSNKSNEPPKDTNDIKEHELVKNIIKDINRPGNVTVLCGYVGKSGSDDLVRLYTDLQFGEYLEIKRVDILASKEVSDDVIPFGGTCIFVDDNTEIRKVKIETTKQQAMFLGGKISETFVKDNKKYQNTNQLKRVINLQRLNRVSKLRRNLDTLDEQTMCFACITEERSPCIICEGPATFEKSQCGDCGPVTDERSPCIICEGPATFEKSQCGDCGPVTDERTPCIICEGPVTEGMGCTLDEQTMCFAC